MTVSFTHINFLMQPSQTARMEAWQKCVESAVTLAAPTQPQADPLPLAQALPSKGAPSAGMLSMEAPMGKCLEGNLVVLVPLKLCSCCHSMCGC